MKPSASIFVIFGILAAVSLFLSACSPGATASAPPWPTERPLPTVPPVATVVPAAADAVGPFRLTILHNNDGESQLVNLGSGLEDYGGVARFAAVVQREKQTAESGEAATGKNGVIMVSSGDDFLAGPEFTVGLRSRTFYDALALDLIGYDAIALGNHDFDFGPEVLASFINQVSTSQAPFLSSNLDFSAEPALRDLVNEGRIAASVVVEKNGEKIGIIGATTLELPIISSPRRVKVLSDVAGEVQSEVDRLSANGVNKIVLISHLQDLDADIALVGQIEGVDVVVAGGGAEILANECDLLIPGDNTAFGPYPVVATTQDGTRIPVVTTAGQYSYLGKLVVLFDVAGNLVGIDEGASGPIRIASGDVPAAVQPDCEIQRRVVSQVKIGLQDLAAPIATSQVALEGRRSEVRSRETNQGNLIADAIRWQASRLAPDYGAPLPDVAMQNGGGIRNDLVLTAGPIRELDTFDMAPFSNLVTVVEGISRERFKQILENSVSRAVDGDIAEGTGRFVQVSGFRFEWSQSGTAQVLNPDGSVAVSGTRVQRVVLVDGTVIVGGGRVVAGAPLTLATNDFLARGGDGYNFHGAPFTVLGVTYQQALANYIQFADGLGGEVTATDYPEGGAGRIVRLP